MPTPQDRDEFRKLLEAGDVDGLRRAWAAAAPHLPQPPTRAAAEKVMHLARTQTGSITLRARAYSHAWLIERGLPSNLPDQLRPAAERLYPRVVEAVGISVNFKNPHLAPVSAMVRNAMEDVVETCYADGDTDPELVRSQMLAAKDQTLRACFGRTLPT